MSVKRAPSAPTIDLVLSMLYVAPYRLPGDDVSGSSVSRPSKPGQVGHVFILQPSRRPGHLNRNARPYILPIQKNWSLSYNLAGSSQFAFSNIVPTAFQRCPHRDTSLV